MSPSETRAFRRATLLLLALSLIRWAATFRHPEPPAAAASAAADLQDASSAELLEARRRAEPLSAGERLDPNRATAVELDRLPGVGPSTAEAIVRDREARGPYRTDEDLLRVAGVGGATLDRIRPHLDLVGPPLDRRTSEGRMTRRRVGLNRASAEELQSLPGIGPALAGRIVAARRERAFVRVDDLLGVSGIGPATLEKLRPLVDLGGFR